MRYDEDGNRQGRVLLIGVVVLLFVIWGAVDLIFATSHPELAWPELLRNFFFTLAVGWAAILLYFLPAFIAIYRRHARDRVIFGVTMFAGWTGVLWLLCLVWSLLPRRWQALGGQV